LVDRECLAFAESWQLGDLNDSTLAVLRSTPAPLNTAIGPGVVVTEKTIPGPPGVPEQRLLIVTPSGLGPKAPVFFYIHGGGYVFGKPEDMVVFASTLAKECDCVVVLPSYRLAPETRWPGPIEDLYAALCWLRDHATTVGVDTSRIAIGGSSAGGGHAAALALYARARGGPSISFQLLHCPQLDDREVANPYLGEYGWKREHNRYGWTSLLGMPAGGPDVPAEAVPARALDLSRLPPAYIGTGALDLFAESCLTYSQRLMAAGVAVELHVIPGGYHGFEFMVPEAAISKLQMSDISRVLKSAFGTAA
jgi:triacylglycerol lipase